MGVTLTTPVIDTDSHLTEPPDLWTSRMSAREQEIAPRVERDPASNMMRWRVGEHWLSPVGSHSHAGWKEFQPSIPLTFEEIDPACYDAGARAGWLDQHGITAQVLYPNLVAFEGYALMSLKDPAASVRLIQVYNDYVSEFAAREPGRFIPLTAVPFWDIESSIAEMTRCREKGHSGLVWAATMSRHGLPDYTDPYWDRFYAAAQDLGMSINFHVGIGKSEDEKSFTLKASVERAREFNILAERTALAFLSNANTIAHVIMSGVCDRFPRLNFVSVESGFGFIPFLLEALDWQWSCNGGLESGDGKLIPSEYFRRQIYTMFWFEQISLPLLKLYPDNVMFETDFPHKTSLSPGPGSNADSPREYAARAIGQVGAEVMTKVLFGNAARVYGYGQS